MSLIQANTSAAFELVEGIAVQLTGATASQRKLSLVEQGLTIAAANALSNTKGKLGTAIRAGQEQAGITDAVRQAANGRYLSIGQLYAFHTGNNITINSADEFRAMPFAISQLIEAERKKKNGGKKVDAKTGLTIDVPVVAALMTMHAVFSEAIRLAEQIKAKRAEERAAKEQAAIAN